MSGNVGSGIAELGMVDNVGVGLGISQISHSVPEIQCTSGLESAILNFRGRRMSGNVGSGIAESGMVDNVGVGLGIS